MKPSDFKRQHPYGSVLRKSECETVARNIMIILTRTGDAFRDLTWEEYEAERKKDGKFHGSEKGYFDIVKPYCASADTAIAFCPNWHKYPTT